MTCPKCGSIIIDYTYRYSKDDLLCRCARCNYMWDTLPKDHLQRVSREKKENES